MTTLSVTIPTLRTERLVMRAPAEKDIPAIIAFLGSERARFIGGPMEAHHAFRSYTASLGHWMLRGYGFWTVADAESDEALGRVGILYGEGWHEPEIGWHVFEGSEGRGIAYEAAIAARRYAAEVLDLHGLISYIDPANERSRNLAERMGATFERDVTFFGGPAQIWRQPVESAE